MTYEEERLNSPQYNYITDTLYMAVEWSGELYLHSQQTIFFFIDIQLQLAVHSFRFVSVRTSVQK